MHAGCDLAACWGVDTAAALLEEQYCCLLLLVTTYRTRPRHGRRVTA